MNFEVYCDESSPEVLKDRSANKYLVLGSIWFPDNFREYLKGFIYKLKNRHGYHNEIKWNKVSPSTIEFYSELVQFFYIANQIRFRALIVEADNIDMVKFHNDDSELSFYKFYYQLLHHWILDFNQYSIFLDHKISKDVNRISDLKRVLKNTNLFSEISNVQALPSRESIGIQLADLLTGMVNGKVNEKISSESKIKLIQQLEIFKGSPIQPTPKSEEKFNVFKINLKGGW